MSKLKELYNRVYAEDKGGLIDLRPDALSTSRYDDVARLIRDFSCKGKFLEVGCGSGVFLLSLAKTFNCFDEYVGIDISDVRINAAKSVMIREKINKNIRFEAVDADAGLPFADNTFDCVVACAVIEHVVEIFKVMDEISRVCKKGGYLIITVPNICYLKHIVDALFGNVPLTGWPVRDIKSWRENGWDGGHLHNFSRKQLYALLADCGFKPLKRTGDGKWAKLRRWGTNLVGSLTVIAQKI